MLGDLNLKDFLEKLGSGSSTPGGGGATALTGAQAAGLVTMVGRLTVGREEFAAIEERVREVIAEGDRLRLALIECIDHDAAAFQAVMNAYGLPRATTEEKLARSAVLQAALKSATESPLAIARHCASLGQMAAEMAEEGNPHTITDAGTAALLADAALIGAILQARVNLKSIKDQEYVKVIRAEIDHLQERSGESKKRALEAAERKLV